MRATGSDELWTGRRLANAKRRVIYVLTAGRELVNGDRKKIKEASRNIHVRLL